MSDPMFDALESRDFYEQCQTYRHADDVIGQPTASEAFEDLKAWIRRHALVTAVPIASPYREDAA